MGDKKEGDPTSPATDIYLATCNDCQLLLAVGLQYIDVSPSTGNHNQLKHEIWVGLMTVDAMVDWLEELLIEEGLRA